MYSTIKDFMDYVELKNPGEKEFHQAVHEVIESLWDYLNNKFTNNDLLLIVAGQGDENYTQTLKSIVDKKEIRNKLYLTYNKITIIMPKKLSLKTY